VLPPDPEPLLVGGGVLLGGRGGVVVYGTAYQMVRRVQCPGPRRRPEQVTIATRSAPWGRKTFLTGTLFAR
jgi:hypothetical protein